MKFYFGFYYAIAVIFACYIIALEVIPERAGIDYVNPKYAAEVKVYVRRYGRASPYSVNIEARTLVTIANYVSLNIVFYELLNNEYKPSFVNMSFRACDMILREKFFSPLLKRIGLICPLPPNEYKLLNLTLHGVPAIERFPYQWPFEMGKADAFLTTYPGKELMARGHCMLKFKQTKKKQR